MVKEVVFCFKNCSEILWEKIVIVIEKNFCKFEAEGKDFTKYHQNNSFKQ